MTLKRSIRENITKIRLFSTLYEKVYLKAVARKRRNVTLVNPNGNTVIMPPNTYCDDLKIIFKGQGNVVRIGEGCVFKQSNNIYIQDDKNLVEIGDHVTFDQNTQIVVAEGSQCRIGSECIFANGVRIRTSDQHGIYDENGNRINPARNIEIGSHVWLGASVTVMKGVSIGGAA